MVSAGTFGPIRIIKNQYALSIENLLNGLTGSFQEKTENPAVTDAKTSVSWADSYVRGKTDNAPVLTGEVQVLVKDLPAVKDLMDGIIKEAEEIIKKRLPSFVA